MHGPLLGAGAPLDAPTPPQCANDRAEPVPGVTADTGPPRVWTVFVAFGLATVAILFLTGLLAAAVVAGLIARSPDSAGDSEALAIATGEFLTSAAGLVLAAAISSGTLMAVAFLGGLLSPQALPQRLRLASGPFRAPYVLALVAGLCLSQGLDSIIALQGWQEGGSLELIAIALARATPMGVAFAILTIGFMAGIGEELFFRGYLQTRLSARWGSLAGVLIAAALFGLVHMDPVHSLFAFLFGIYLGWVTERSMSILPAVTVHIANNCASVVLTRLFTPPLDARTHMGLVAISLVLGIASFMALRHAFLRRSGVTASSGR